MSLHLERKNVFFLFYLLLIVSLLFSKIIVSICTITLLCLGLFTRERNGRIGFGIPDIFKESDLLIVKSKPYLGFFILFAWMVLSILWSDDLNSYGNEILGKFLIPAVPLVFILAPKLGIAQIKRLHYFFYGLILLCSILVLGVYMLNSSEISAAMGRGKSVPTPIDHIRFSMMVGYSYLSILGFITQDRIQGRVMIWLFRALAFFFFIMVHILAVRTGIVLVYVGSLVIALYMIISKKWLIKSLMILGLLIAMPIISYLSFPTLQNKINYSLQDYKVWRNDDISDEGFSDNDRILSITNGMKIWSNQWLIGSGAGDYDKEIVHFYKDNYPNRRILIPHNQYVRTGVAYGLIGVLLMLIAILLPLFNKKQHQNIILQVFVIIYLISFLVEANWERYYSLAFFMYFYSWLLELGKQSKV